MDAPKPKGERRTGYFPEGGGGVALNPDPEPRSTQNRVPQHQPVGVSEWRLTGLRKEYYKHGPLPARAPEAPAQGLQ
jgi:hypothetical protein